MGFWSKKGTWGPESSSSGMVVLVTTGVDRVALGSASGGMAVLVGLLSEAEPVVRVMTSVTVCAEVEVMRQARRSSDSGSSSCSSCRRRRRSEHDCKGIRKRVGEALLLSVAMQAMVSNAPSTAVPCTRRAVWTRVSWRAGEQDKVLDSTR